MVPARIVAILAVAAVVAFGSSAIVTTSYDVTTQKELIKFWTATRETPTFNFTEDDDDGRNDEDGEIDGIPLKYLTPYEIKELVNCEDSILSAELDILVARKVVLKRVATRPPNENHNKSLGHRTKRFAGALFRGLLTAGRHLFKGAANAPKPTVSGNRVTQQYIKPGGYKDAVKHFDKFKPNNVKPFNTKQGISGKTGTVGQHRFTVRDGSKQGSATLEIRTPKQKGEFVRKFRFEEKKHGR